jgi:hypothetical protein
VVASGVDRSVKALLSHAQPNENPVMVIKTSNILREGAKVAACQTVAWLVIGARSFYLSGEDLAVGLMWIVKQDTRCSAVQSAGPTLTACNRIGRSLNSFPGALGAWVSRTPNSCRTLARQEDGYSVGHESLAVTLDPVASSDAATGDRRDPGVAKHVIRGGAHSSARRLIAAAIGASADGGPLDIPNEVAFFNGLNKLPIEV